MSKVLAVCGVGVVATAASVGVVSAELDDNVTILHGIPGITVDLVVDGEIVIAGFEAGDTQDITPLAGMTLHNIEARQAGGDEVVIGPIASFDVPGEGNASVVVHLDGAGEPKLTPFFNMDAPPSEQGRGLLTVRHVAAAPEIGIEIEGAATFGPISNGTEAGAVLPAGEIREAWITVDNVRIAPLPTLVLDATSQLIVYVGGSLELDNLVFYLQSVAGGEVGPVSDAAVAQPSDDAAEAQPVDDGTPQPDQVNTGAAFGVNDRGGIVKLMISGAAFAVALGAFLVRRHLSVRSSSVIAGIASPWPAPSIEDRVRS